MAIIQKQYITKVSVLIYWWSRSQIIGKSLPKQQTRMNSKTILDPKIFRNKLDYGWRSPFTVELEAGIQSKRLMSHLRVS